jgi:hypothetical protein
MTATERSPLLKSGDINTNYNDNAVVQNENAGEISVIPSAGSDDTQEGQEEEVRKSRLNGSSLLVILFGYFSLLYSKI